MTGAFLFLAALDCLGCGALLSEVARRAHPAEPEASRSFAQVSFGLVVAGLGCLIWSKGV